MNPNFPGASNFMADPSLEDTDFLETVKFISQTLMEENIEQRPFYDPVTLQLTEKSFYDALKDNVPLSPGQHPSDSESPDGNGTTTSSGSSSSSSANNFLHENSSELTPPSQDTTVPFHGDHAFQLNSHIISRTPSQFPLDLDSSVSKLLAQNVISDTDSVSQFMRGLEEASKFLPLGPQLVTGLESKEEAPIMVGENSFGFKGRKNHEGRKNREREETDATKVGRSNKQSAVGDVDEDDLSDMFDRLMVSVESEPGEKPPSSDGWKDHPKRQGRKKGAVDLRNLLLLCSQALHANDNRAANELLLQIRQHSSPSGDGLQRLAHYLANGLEARLVGDADGTRAQVYYTSPSNKSITNVEFLKGYELFLSTCPYKKFAFLFANKMIMKVAAKAETLHIIDFGILYGFQWPLLIKFLSNRDGGPPKLRITGIEVPQPGFRPTEIIEDTGRRLADYCKRFNVPFEYNPIASRNWETIEIENLKIESNELVAVNCMMRFKNLLDETIEGNSPRNAVLHLIRKVNPNIFTHAIYGGPYNSPFFATRFREALFHYSAFYDMCDTVMPRKDTSRMMIERDIVGREAMNVIACEGSQRVERPETYKQWQVRNTRAGFKQLPLDQELMANFRTKLREWGQRDFILDEDDNWMLQGWKGRILYASSCWVPA